LNTIIDISACKRRERKAQQQLFNHFAPYVFTVCRRYSSTNEDAQEAMQDCFVRIFNKLDAYNHHKGELKPWVAKISVNICLNRLRIKKSMLPASRAELKEHHFNIPLVQDTEQDEKEEVLLNAIQKLSTGYRQILNLFVFERLKHKEIAEMLNISEGTSRSQLTRAKSQLKRIIEKNKITHYGI